LNRCRVAGGFVSFLGHATLADHSLRAGVAPEIAP
jgi:hypothetical protein